MSTPEHGASNEHTEYEQNLLHRWILAVSEHRIAAATLEEALHQERRAAQRLRDLNAEVIMAGLHDQFTQTLAEADNPPATDES